MKSFYELEDKVEQYIEMAKGYDGKDIINELTGFLQPPASILELGMGPGVDLDLLLNTGYKATGSDLSNVFLEKYKAKNKEADLLHIDAIHIDTSRTFDGIYSNKVLHHLTLTELEKSLLRQTHVLNNNGIVCHSFWQGDESTEIEGMFFQYYRLPQLAEVFEMNYTILLSKVYTEMEKDDSILIIAKALD